MGLSGPPPIAGVEWTPPYKRFVIYRGGGVHSTPDLTYWCGYTYKSKKSGVILAKNPTWRLTRGEGPPNNEKIQHNEVQQAEISMLCSWNRFFEVRYPEISKKWCNIGKKPYLTTYQGGGPPPIMEKYRILWCNTLKFRNFVVVTAFFGSSRGAFWKNTIMVNSQL